MEPKQGLLTYMAEGNNIPNSMYYSRKIHWPGNSLQCSRFGSGVTIGRGYDLQYRNEWEVISDLTISGIPLDKAKKIAKGVTKSHCLASDFVRKNKDSIEDITEIQQLRLFEKTYRKYVVDSERFYNRYKKKDCVPWHELKQPLKDVIDLIHTRIKLSSDELGRKRIPYLEKYMK